MAPSNDRAAAHVRSVAQVNRLVEEYKKFKQQQQQQDMIDVATTSTHPPLLLQKSVVDEPVMSEDEPSINTIVEDVEMVSATSSPVQVVVSPPAATPASLSTPVAKKRFTGRLMTGLLSLPSTLTRKKNTSGSTRYNKAKASFGNSWFMEFYLLLQRCVLEVSK